MPLSYPNGVVEEHRRCRSAAAVFDVSHLGCIQLNDKDSFASLQKLLSNDLSRISPGKAQYTHLLNENGGVIDDLIVWWIDENRFHIIPNAANTGLVADILQTRAVTHENITAERALFAIQGPNSRTMLSKISTRAAAVSSYEVLDFLWEEQTCFAAGTGYTGEDGVECYLPAQVAGTFWSALLEVGIFPAGLAARDTLRLEAGLPLYGHELTSDITPLEAGLDWVIGWSKPDFVGKKALQQQKDTGIARMLKGVLLKDRRPLHDGERIFHNGTVVGTITSGNFSPILQRGVGLCMISIGIKDNDRVLIDVRGNLLEAQVVKPPFVTLKADKAKSSGFPTV